MSSDVCGIAGELRSDNGRGDAARVQPMLDDLMHRGPDSSGVHVGRFGAVGQTRLAIIDVLHGDPPIADESGLHGVALNGEIYNYRELRAELTAAGHTFRTGCDTEVLAHLAEEMPGVELAQRLVGMFAFAIWDDEREELVLGRDRFGKKPLHYWQGPRGLVFASEIKALLRHADVPERMDSDALRPYLTFGYVPSPRTFFEDIRSVPPGHVLTVSRAGEVTLAPYWAPAAPGLRGVGQLPFDMPTAAASVRQALAAAVRKRLVADVPLGAFLSGGVDSSAVVALMAAELGRGVQTFTIGFEDDDGFDERPYAARVAKLFATDHHEFVVKPDAIDLVERLVWAHDQPFGDSSAIPTYLLSELTRQHVTVALCGDGGDELFAGYERFAAGVVASRLRHVPSFAVSVADAAIASVRGAAGRSRVRSARRLLARLSRPMPDAYRGFISYVPDAWVDRLTRSGDDWAREDYRRIWAESEGASTLDRLQLLNIRTYLLDDLLPKVDRTSMATALEVRAPFLDHDLADIALRLRPSLRLRGLDGKRVLKHAMADVLPHDLLYRHKHGFGVPLDRWFRHDLVSFVDAMLMSPDARLRGHVDGDAVSALVGAHAAGESHGHALWTLLTLEVFLRKHGW